MQERVQEGEEVNGQVDHFFSRRLLRLQSRVESIQVKVVSLSKVVRLLQQYTERKDQQYEKQANQYHLLQHKLDRVNDIESHINTISKRYDEITHQIHLHNNQIDQFTRALHDCQKACKDSAQRHIYEVQEVTVKLQRLETGLLQQLRDEGRRHAEGSNVVKSYNLDELHFKIAQLEQSHKGDLQKIKHKIDKLIKKPQEDEYGLEEVAQKRDKSKDKGRKASNSLLKRVKSK